MNKQERLLPLAEADIVDAIGPELRKVRGRSGQQIIASVASLGGVNWNAEQAGQRQRAKQRNFHQRFLNWLWQSVVTSTRLAQIFVGEVQKDFPVAFGH